MSNEKNIEEIQELPLEIQQQLEAAHNKMNAPSQQVYYTEMVSKHC
jgi:hypothetical protein